MVLLTAPKIFLREDLTNSPLPIICFDDVSSNNEWIVADNDTLNPIEHDVVKDEGGHDLPLLEEIDD